MEGRIVKNGTVKFQGGTYCHKDLLLLEGERVLIEPDPHVKDGLSVRSMGLALICVARRNKKYQQLPVVEPCQHD
ncbi:MAG: Mu transposase C-terminal domain-containing protein [bacterium]